MPLRMKITPLTLYEENQTIFDGLIENLPKRPFERSSYYDDLFLTGFDVDSETLIDGILIECGQMNVFYTDPSFFKHCVTNWAKRNKYKWQREYETMFFRYNPIWNKDGTIKDNALQTRDLSTNKNDSLTTTKGNIQSVNKSISETGTVNENRDLETSNNGSDVIERSSLNTETLDTLESFDGEVKTQINSTENEERELTGTDYNNKDLYETTNNVTDNTGTQRNANNTTVIESLSAYNETGFTNRNKTETTEDNTRTDNLKETLNGTKTTKGDDNHDTTEEGTIDKTLNRGEDVIDTHEIANTGTIKNNLAFDETLTKENTETNSGDILTTKNLLTTESGTINDTGTETATNTGTGKETGTIADEHIILEHGNIGITTTQSMIAEEREIVKYNIYDVIISEFKTEFCLLIY